MWVLLGQNIPPLQALLGKQPYFPCVLFIGNVWRVRQPIASSIRAMIEVDQIDLLTTITRTTEKHQ